MRVDQWRFWILVGLLDFLGTLLVGTGVGVVDLQFWKIYMSEVFFDENLCLFQYSST